jgi:hypothetical protein
MKKYYHINISLTDLVLEIESFQFIKWIIYPKGRITASPELTSLISEFYFEN